MGNVTAFVAPSLRDAYATITSFQSVVGNFTPTAAGIFSRMTPSDVHVTDRGRTFTDAQAQAITAWLAEETAERGDHTAEPSATGRLLNQWTACMTLARWQAADMTTAWGNLETNDGTRCTACHADGDQGMMVSDVESTIASGPPGMWSIVSSKERYLIQYFTVDLSGQTPQLVVNTKSFEGVALGNAPHATHPRFDPTSNAGMAALIRFYNDTMTDMGNCSPNDTKLSPPAS